MNWKMSYWNVANHVYDQLFSVDGKSSDFFNLDFEL